MTCDSTPFSALNPTPSLTEGGTAVNDRPFLRGGYAWPRLRRGLRRFAAYFGLCDCSHVGHPILECPDGN